MSKKHFVKRLILIINKLRNSPCSFKEIQQYLCMQSDLDSENYDISLRTFQRDLKEIYLIFDIDIKPIHSKGLYTIDRDIDDKNTDRLLECFTLFDAISSTEILSKDIHLENRRPLGTEHMHELLIAIKNKLQVAFTHEKFWIENTEKQTRTVYPLALKEARNRWYLVAQDSKDRVIKTFGLDRISDLEITRRKFEAPSDFDAVKRFEHSFGIISDGTTPEKIRLCFSHRQADFIKSFPLHHSQTIVSENEYECIIELFLSPTYDFIMELLSIGKEVKVQEPESLKNKMIEVLQATLQQYITN